MNSTSRPPGRETKAWLLAHRLTAFGKWLLEPDHLPPAPPQSSPDAPAPSLYTWLESQQSLPYSAEKAATGKRFISWLASTEPVPDTAAKNEPAHESILYWLLNGERLATNQPTRPMKETSTHGS